MSGHNGELGTGVVAWQDKPVCVYLLDNGYIGITHRPRERLRKHRKLGFATDMLVIEWYPTRREALLAEAWWHARGWSGSLSG